MKGLTDELKPGKDSTMRKSKLNLKRLRALDEPTLKDIVYEGLSGLALVAMLCVVCLCLMMG